MRASTQKSIWLIDLLRWVSAGLVVLSHARDNMMADYAASGATGSAVKLWYFATGLGHQAVVIFFVLSGYLVGGRLWLQYVEAPTVGRSLRDYFAHRFSRVYIVLAPAILITWGFDSVGASWFAAAHIYDRTGWSHSLDFVANARLTVPTALCNLADLQVAFCSPFGSNGPLWSLSYEWFYYVTFPALALIVATGDRWMLRRANVRYAAHLAAVGAILFGAYSLLIPFRDFIIYYPIWLFGAAACVVPSIRRLPRILTLIGVVGMMAFMVVERFGIAPSVLSDYAIGFGLALILADRKVTELDGPCQRANGVLAGFSYSLYAIHFPVLIFLVAAFRAAGYFDTRLGAGLISFALVSAAISIVYVLAWAFSRVTEKHTQRVRKMVSVLLKWT